MRNAKVIDLTQAQNRTLVQRSPTAASHASLSRIQTNLSDTQKMKMNNPFARDNHGEQIIHTQTALPTETHGEGRLRTTLAHTHAQQTTGVGGQGGNGVYELTKSAMGFTQRIL